MEVPRYPKLVALILPHPTRSDRMRQRSRWPQVAPVAVYKFNVHAALVAAMLSSTLSNCRIWASFKKQFLQIRGDILILTCWELWACNLIRKFPMLSNAESLKSRPPRLCVAHPPGKLTDGPCERARRINWRLADKEKVKLVWGAAKNNGWMDLRIRSSGVT